MITERRRKLLESASIQPDDVRFDTGRAIGGDFIRVRHIPSGIERLAMRADGRTHDDLLVEVIDELLRR